MKLIILMITLFLTSMDLCAQIDTTLKEFWPLGLGDTWQYHNEFGQIYQRKVIKEDTLLPNGYMYTKFGVGPNFNTSYGYERIDSLLRVQWYAPWGSDSCGGTAPSEISIYRLGDPLGSIWRDCLNWNGFLGPAFIRYDGIHLKTAFGQARETMVFQFGYYDATINDTIFAVEDWVIRGIGLYRRQYWWSGGYEILTGAIINGVQYGTIVSIDDLPQMIPQRVTLHQNYPNPFNPRTTIRYDIRRGGHATLKVYNLLGQEIAVLADNYHQPGSYEVTFDASHLSSGFYIYSLHTGGIVLTRRMLFIK